MKAGKYLDRFELSSRSVSPSASGKPVETFTGGVFLYGKIENEVSGTFSYFDSIHGSRSAVIRLRNYVTVSVRDRLRHTEFNETWTIVSWARGDNEIVCNAVK